MSLIFITKLLVLLLLPLLFTAVSCNKPTEPPPPQPPPPPIEEPVITLQLDDAHCTEAWIVINTIKLTLPSLVSLTQFNPNGDTVYSTFLLNSKDSIIYLDSLLPNKSYSCVVTSNWVNEKSDTLTARSNGLQFTTMDTTSNNFTFEMITFGGEIGSSVLYDVAIINENNIWAVGDIWIKSDTTNTGYIKYNAVHWNGNTWKLYRIMFYTVCGQTNLTPYPARSVFALNENDVWIAMDGDQIARMDGENQVSIQCLPISFSIFKLWGSSNNNLYAVGYGGNIAHYNGTSWSKLASGTTLNINDIWGDYNPKTNEWEILAAGGNILAGHDNVLLQVKNSNSVEKVSSENANWPLRSLWFISNRNYYISGSGIYQKHFLDENAWKNDIFLITTYSTNRIRGREINDIAATGGAGELIHFNGNNWKSFIDVVGIPGNYYGTAIFNNTIVTVGQSSNRAILTIGRR